MSDDFDPAVFENAVFEGANETKTTPVPIGDHLAIVDTVKVDKMQINKGERAGQSVPILRVAYKLLDENGALKALLGRDTIIVRQDVWLDVENGALSFKPNMNVGLGRLREAVNMNDPRKPFAFKMLEGAGPINVTVEHDVQASGDVYSRVRRVAKPQAGH